MPKAVPKDPEGPACVPGWLVLYPKPRRKLEIAVRGTMRADGRLHDREYALVCTAHRRGHPIGRKLVEGARTGEYTEYNKLWCPGCTRGTVAEQLFVESDAVARAPEPVAAKPIQRARVKADSARPVRNPERVRLRRRHFVERITGWDDGRPPRLRTASHATVERVPDGQLTFAFSDTALVVEFRLLSNCSAEARDRFGQMYDNRDQWSERLHWLELEWDMERRMVRTTFTGGHESAPTIPRSITGRPPKSGGKKKKGDTARQGKRAWHLDSELNWVLVVERRDQAARWASGAILTFRNVFVSEFRYLPGPDRSKPVHQVEVPSQAATPVPKKVSPAGQSEKPEDTTPSLANRNPVVPELPSVDLDVEDSELVTWMHIASADYRRRVLALEAAPLRETGARLVSSGSVRRRSGEARLLVIARSGGRCESPICGNPAFREMTAAGDPILEVDHVRDLALGGADHPINMIALCPNCHAVKTRGVESERLREAFRNSAKVLHEALMSELA